MVYIVFVQYLGSFPGWRFPGWELVSFQLFTCALYFVGQGLCLPLGQLECSVIETRQLEVQISFKLRNLTSSVHRPLGIVVFQTLTTYTLLTLFFFLRKEGCCFGSEFDGSAIKLEIQTSKQQQKRMINPMFSSLSSL